MAQLEVFTPDGIYTGVTSRLPLIGDGPTLDHPLPLEGARWYPNDGTTPAHHGSVSIPPDDILVVVLPEPELKVHTSWYPLTLDCGPYRLVGRFETQPGFDPDRALTRPSGGFVPLHEAVIELRGRADAGAAERAYVQVNRFAVERVVSPLSLTLYFPGASFVEAEGATVGVASGD
ncbi:MAG TPA: hypothetical protein VK831_03105 [Candidatus Deferrimicrobiaceae bacterium]|nr:hypothetical protein [Candidatus Deferrimicrobiaceae bacterium]